MKIIFSIFLFFISGFLFGQQKDFYHVPQKNPDFRAPVFSSKLSEIFLTPDSWTSITINVEDLSSAPDFDFSKLTNLELVQIQFSFSPDSSDAAKKIYIDKVDKWMENLTYFSKCPKLKYVIFGIGEQIYLTQKECSILDPEKKHFHKNYKTLSAQNKKNAWNSFGKDVNVLLPKVKLYAYTWNW